MSQASAHVSIYISHGLGNYIYIYIDAHTGHILQDYDAGITMTLVQEPEARHMPVFRGTPLQSLKLNG